MGVRACCVSDSPRKLKLSRWLDDAAKRLKDAGNQGLSAAPKPIHPRHVPPPGYLLYVELPEDTAAEVGARFLWVDGHWSARCLHDKLNIFLTALEPDCLVACTDRNRYGVVEEGGAAMNSRQHHAEPSRRPSISGEGIPPPERCEATANRGI